MKHKTDVPNERVIFLVEQGLSTEEIGKELGMSGRAVRYRLEKLGIKTAVRDKGLSNLVEPENQRRAIENSKATWEQKKQVVYCTCEMCGKQYRPRRPVLKSVSRFCSPTCRNKWLTTIRGNEHWNYTGSNSNEQRQRLWVESREWKDAVLKRDKHRCVNCGCRGKLQAHHLYSWHAHPDLRFDVNNGVALCAKCHRNFHKEYGMKNNTKEQFDEFKTSAGWKRSALSTF